MTKYHCAYCGKEIDNESNNCKYCAKPLIKNERITISEERDFNGLRTKVLFDVDTIPALRIALKETELHDETYNKSLQKFKKEIGVFDSVGIIYSDKKWLKN